MALFSGKLLESKFFIDPNNTIVPLTYGEISCTILPDFPQAKYQNIKYVAVPGLIITYDYPLKGKVTISVERVIEANYFYVNSVHTLSMPIKQEEPISIHSTNLTDLCNKGVFCEQGSYSRTINNAGGEVYSLKEYLIVYNCIGWALGIRDWINPSTEKCLHIINAPLGCFVNLAKNFLNIISTKYNSTPEKKLFIQEDIISKLNQTVFCSEAIPDIKLINQKGAVAFYFKNGKMTHAARFVHKIEEIEFKSWVSKLGHGIMIAHDLEDLAGNDSLYGNPLCYAIPLNYESNCIGAIGECTN